MATTAPEAVATGDEAAAGARAEPVLEGACGWTKAETSLELICGGQRDGVSNLSVSPDVSHCSGTVCLSLTCLSLCPQSTLYLVDPLFWCPHLDAIKPLPPSGIDVFLPCQDCGSNTENWICLTCYQVTGLTQSMVSHLLMMMSESHLSSLPSRCSVVVTSANTW